MTTNREIFTSLWLKDVRCMWRSKQILTSTFGFALLLIVVSSFAFRTAGYGQEELKSITPGILWLAFLFTSVISLNHSFTHEREHDALTGVVLTGVDPSYIFFAKFFTNLLYLASLQLFLILTHALFFGADLMGSVPSLFLVSVLAAVGFIALGTLLSAVSAVTSGREIVLPLVLFPLAIPLVAAAVFLSRETLVSGVVPVENFWFHFLCLFDLISVVLSWALFGYAVGE